MANLHLVTMPPSPHSEKARWALDMLGQDYYEERCAPPFHRSALKRMNAGGTVPALKVINTGQVHTDSWDILAWVDAQLPAHHKIMFDDPTNRPIVKDFCERCDTKLQPDVRNFLYAHMTGAQFTELLSRGVPEDQAKKFRWISPVVFFVFKKKAKIDLAKSKMSAKRIGQFFDQVGDLLHGGRNYLYGDRLSVADIIFCSVAAPILCLPEFGGATLDIEAAPDLVRDEARRLRETPAGKFVASLYRDYRNKTLL